MPIEAIVAKHSRSAGVQADDTYIFDFRSTAQYYFTTGNIDRRMFEYVKTTL